MLENDYYSFLVYHLNYIMYVTIVIYMASMDVLPMLLIDYLPVFLRFFI